MRTIITLLLPFGVFFHCYAYEIPVGTNTLDVVFESDKLSSNVMNRIVSDIIVCRQAWSNSTVVTFSTGRPGGYINDLNVQVSPYGFLGAKFPQSVVTNSSGKLALFIPAELSTRYIEAFSFTNIHSNVYQQAILFVDRLQSPELANTSQEKVRDLVFSPGVTESQYIASAYEILTDIQRQTYYYPSVLGFWKANDGEAASSHTNLFVLIPQSSKHPHAPHQLFDVMPAIWHDSKWKLWQPGAAEPSGKTEP